MSTLVPHLTVACVIPRENTYLLVEERDKRSGKMVFNQPAGHVESGETLPEAALRETLEETCWEVTLSGVLSVALYTAPANGTTYCRTTFLAEPAQQHTNLTMDEDIHALHWLSYEEIVAISAKLRSPLVMDSIERHRQGILHPLDLLHST